MSPLRLILRSLVYHGRSNVAVALGVAAGAAVLCGALLVGDSMRGSLEDLTFERLGPVDEVILADRFFREELAGELAAASEFPEGLNAVPLILVKGSVENADAESDGRAGGIQILGCGRQFWESPGAAMPEGMGSGKIALNRELADALEVQPGGTVLVYLPGGGNIPGDSLLGTKRDTVRPVRLEVGGVIEAEAGWVGRFSLRPSQQEPMNLYVPLELLQSRLERAGRVNAILVTGPGGRLEPPQEQHEAVARALRPAAADYGLSIARVGEGPQSYINITTDRLLFGPEVAKPIREVLSTERYQAAFTYLANTIARARHEEPVTEQEDAGRIVPYSTITALDFDESAPLGPLRTPDGNTIPPLEDTEREEKLIVLNQWAAESLGISRRDWPGEGDLRSEGRRGRETRAERQETRAERHGEPIRVYVSFFEPESTHGQTRRRVEPFRLAAVVAMEGPAVDPQLTPTVPGLTDKRSIEDWNVPFQPFYRDLIRKTDDVYYRQYGLVPKAFVSLANGQRLWGSRFGQTTSFRVVPGETASVESLGERIGQAIDPATAGFVLLPVKRQGIEASAGATPFNVLFLMFSFFIIAAAVMLVALLFRLGIERRAAELGVLLAVGFPRRKVARLLAAEGLLVATLGSLLGVPLGIGYAGLMLWGLQTLWIDAIVTPFLTLHVGTGSLVAGFLSGVVVSLGAILWAVRAMRGVSGRRLLDGQANEEAALVAVCPRWLQPVAWLMLALAVVVGLASLGLGEDAQAGAFFGAGGLVLGGAMLLAWQRLRSGATGPAVAEGRANLLRMALRNAARNPGRSTLSAGLVAATCFLIVATSAFRLDPTMQSPAFDSGNGGFALVGQSDQPIFQDLNSPQGRRRLDFLPEEAEMLEGTTTIAFRVRSGDDASCLNLYRPREPRVLGVPEALVERGGFAWAGTAADTEAEEENPWRLLRKDLGQTADGRTIVPVVIEKNTALYALQLWGGVGSRYELSDGRGGKIPLQIVGLLANGIFQGDLLVSEDAFVKRFPEAGGFRFFLIGCLAERTDAVKRALEKALAGYGLAVETTGARLARFLAVQNTYLLTFLSLGGMGLLLGTFGLAAVQMRNVLERRRELALLRAAGFRRAMLAALVTLENAFLLLLGLGCGVAAAAVAVLPHLFDGRAMIPWGWVAGTLGCVLVVGLLAGLLAVRAAVAAPLLESLRGE